LAGEHIRIREELGLLTRPAEDELAHDRAEQAAWLAELRRLGLVGADPDTDEMIRGLYAYLGRTPSKLLALALPDAVGDVRAQNQPGTTDEYPNWRVPLTGPDGRRVRIEDIFVDRRAAALAEVMKSQVRTMET
jgi:4-alpha-glucanotransferase